LLIELGCRSARAVVIFERISLVICERVVADHMSDNGDLNDL
jgi:hypothetical protein